MINIVQRVFRDDAQRRNICARRSAAARLLCLLAVPALQPASAGARPLPVVCGPGGICEERADARRPPGAPDRDARPFGGSLGRPCAYRWRFTPEGTRRVRVCF